MTSRRGSLEVPVRVDRGLRPGLVFMTLHFPDQVDTNVLTIDATDPKSGTAEFKASAVRIDKLPGRPWEPELHVDARRSARCRSDRRRAGCRGRVLGAPDLGMGRR